MHVISLAPLRAFWQRHRGAETPLRRWHKLMEKNDFANFAEIKDVANSADSVAPFVVFNIGPRADRLIAVIHYNRKKVYVRFVLTHDDYDKGACSNNRR